MTPTSRGAQGSVPRVAKLDHYHPDPAGAQEERIDSTNGIRIFVRSWLPVAAPRAVVVICHGVNSHGGQYLWAGEQFAASGFAVFALDLRGRGQSVGERLYVEQVAD